MMINPIIIIAIISLSIGCGENQATVEEPNSASEETSKASDIDVIDVYGTSASLFDNNSTFTILYFMDIDCIHCVEETPEIMRVYNELKQVHDLNLFAVDVSGKRAEWEAYVHDQKVKNVFYYIKKRSIQTFKAYDLTAAPLIYILDKDKMIISEKMENGKDILNYFQQQES